ncbi:cobalamin biosynthesis protein [Curvibacter sp. CHRR-16]|nr:cobalamin biosynthesis protein [Curvibacter sp. CHRR-16]
MTAPATVAAPALYLGLGCDRGTSLATLEQAVRDALALASAKLAQVQVQVQAVASITLKADESGLLALAQAHGWPLCFYTPAELATVPVPNPSETVRRYTGTPSVSEAAALLLAGHHTGLSHALPASHLLVEKHKHLGADGKNATVSVAVSLFSDQP